MANWTKATLLKRLVEVVAEELEHDPDDVLNGKLPDSLSANALIGTVKIAVLKEAMK